MNSIQSHNSPSKEALDELELHVQECLGNRVRDLRFIRLPDGLVIRGSSYTYYAKQLAQHAIMRATTLPLLANEIVVQ